VDVTDEADRRRKRSWQLLEPRSEGKPEPKCGRLFTAADVPSSADSVMGRVGVGGGGSAVYAGRVASTRIDSGTFGSRWVRCCDADFAEVPKTRRALKKNTDDGKCSTGVFVRFRPARPIRRAKSGQRKSRRRRLQIGGRCAPIAGTVSDVFAYGAMP